VCVCVSDVALTRECTQWGRDPSDAVIQRYVCAFNPRTIETIKSAVSQCSERVCDEGVMNECEV
jgi:hypothetical protein